MKKIFTLLLSLAFFFAFLNGNAQMVNIDYEFSFKFWAYSGYGAEAAERTPAENDGEPSTKVRLKDDNNVITAAYECIAPSVAFPNGATTSNGAAGMYYNETTQGNGSTYSSPLKGKNSGTKYVTVFWEYWEDDLYSRCNYDGLCSDPFSTCFYVDDDYHITENFKINLRGLTSFSLNTAKNTWPVKTEWFGRFGSISHKYSYESFDSPESEYTKRDKSRLWAMISMNYQWNYVGTKSEIIPCNNETSISWTADYPSWSFQASAGSTYEFTTNLPLTSSGSSKPQYMLRLIAGDGHTVLASSWDISPYASRQKVTWTSQSEGTIYVDVIKLKWDPDEFGEKASDNFGILIPKPVPNDKLTYRLTNGNITGLVNLSASETEICSDGGSSTLTVTTPGISYRWFKDNVEIYGLAYQKTVTEPGQYKVNVESASGCLLTSNTVSISYSTDLVPKAIVNISSDAGSAVFQGQNITFTANIGNLGSREPNYLWYDNTIDAADSTSFNPLDYYPYYYSGQDPTYNVEAKPGQKIACISQLYGYSDCFPSYEETSSDTINLNTLIPSVSLSSDIDYFCIGENGTVTLTAELVNSGPNPNYMWVMDGNVIPGANGPTYTTQPGDLDTLLGGGNAHWFMVFFRAFGEACFDCSPPFDQVSSDIKYIYDKPMVTPTINITYNPAFGTPGICLNEPVSLIANTSNTGENTYYNWYRNGQLYASVYNGNTLFISVPQNEDIFNCQMVSDAHCVSNDTTWSNDVIISGLLESLTPALSVTANLDTICSGDMVTFTAIPVNGGDNPTYGWFINNQLVTSSPGPVNTSAITNYGSPTPITVTVKCNLISSELCLTQSSIVTAYYYIVVNPSDSCNQPPVALSKNITVSSDENCLGYATAIDFNNGSTDPESGQLIYNISPPGPFTLGAHNIIFTVTDVEGEIDSSTAVITVIDTFPLEINSVGDVLVELEAGVCETKVTYPELVPTNACATISLVSGLGAGGMFPLGTSTETWMATNNSGDTVKISFNVIVTPLNSLPTLDSIANVTVNKGAETIDIQLTGISQGIDCESQEIMVSAMGINTTLITAITVNYNSTESTGMLQLKIAPEIINMDTISVTVSDGYTMVIRSFVLSVVHENQIPVVVRPIEDQVVNASYELIIPINLTPLVDKDSNLLYTILTNGTETLPSWISLVDDSLRIAPTLADTGCVIVVIKAIEIEGVPIAATDTFQLCVEGYTVGNSNFNTAVFDVQMYPNPTNGEINLKINSSEILDSEVIVRSITGSEVFRKEYKATDLIKIDLSENVSGIYLISLKQGDKFIVKELILDRK